MAIGKSIWIITLNVNGLYAPTKRHRLAEWIQHQDPYICCLQETSDLKTHIDWKWEDEKNILHVNGKQATPESWSSNPHIRQNRP